MRSINIQAARTQLSRLVDEAASGEDIVIAKYGKPVARLTGLKSLKKRRVLGLLRGKLHLPDDIGAPLPKNIAKSFEES